MPIDFPNAPTLNQQFQGYTWDGEKWTGSSAPFASAAPATANPLMDGAVAVGTALKYAREDHVHPSDTTKLNLAGNQTMTGGFAFIAANLGVLTGTVVLNAAIGTYQYGTNNGAFTFSPPTVDCALDILITNGASAGAITFSGFVVGTTGDVLTTVNGAKFMISFRRINATATYIIKALQ